VLLLTWRTIPDWTNGLEGKLRPAMVR